MLLRFIRVFLVVPIVLCSACLAVSQDEPVGVGSAGPLDESGRMVSFSRDIAPLFATHCLECHQGTEAKGGFQVDQSDSVGDYIEPGDASASALLTEYMLSPDPDMLMPPQSHGGPLSAAELALVRVWIDEGADWPADAVVGEGGGAVAVAAPKPQSLAGRVWAFQGYFHPATVHFPIALLLVGGVFVVIGWRFPVLGNHVALSCLFIGTATSVVASAMGWAFAETRGYGAWDRVDFDSEIFWHRWSAILVTVLAIFTSMIALIAILAGSDGCRKGWKLGLLILAAMVGAVGHQGGEMTYGALHYKQAFELLLGESAETSADEQDAPSPDSAVPGEETAEPEVPEPEVPEPETVPAQADESSQAVPVE
jgi:hypothetical protein